MTVPAYVPLLVGIGVGIQIGLVVGFALSKKLAAALTLYVHRRWMRQPDPAEVVAIMQAARDVSSCHPLLYGPGQGQEQEAMDRLRELLYVAATEKETSTP